jgi:Putative metal-binding motif
MEGGNMKAKIGMISVSIILLLVVGIAWAQSVPQLVNYQGRLTDSGGVPLAGDTNVDMTFGFYGAASGGTAYLTILQPNISVTNGLYNVLIGSGTVIPGSENTLAAVFKNHSDVWLGVTVNADGEMTPRSRITSVPYAMKAGDVDTAWLDSYLENNDYDEDGYLKKMAGGDDCNDGDPAINPGAVDDPCDGLDTNCDGIDNHNWVEIGSEIRITFASGDSNWPHMVWTGSEFAVTWDGSQMGENQVYFCRISPDGTKIGDDIIVAVASDNRFDQRLCWTGNEFGLIWTDLRYGGNHEVFYSRLTAAGDTVGPNKQITYLSSKSHDPHLAWTGSEFGLAFGEDYNSDANPEDIFFGRISLDGDTIGPFKRIVFTPEVSWYPSLAWTGSEYGMSWFDYRDLNYEVYFTRLNMQGDTIGPQKRVTYTSTDSRGPEMVYASNKNEFGLTWVEIMGGVQLFFGRIAADGSTIGSIHQLTTSGAMSNQPVWTGSEYGIVFSSSRTSDFEMYFTGASLAGAKINGDQRITYYSGYSRYPSSAWTGSEFGIVWGDRRDGDSYEIYFSRVAADCP